MNIKQCIHLFAAIAFSLSSCSDDSGMGNDFERLSQNRIAKVKILQIET